MTMYEELVKALRTCSERNSCFWLDDTCPYLNSELCDDKSGKAADAIEDLQKQLQKSDVDNINLTGWLAEEHAKHQWIPVTERLPENEEVLCINDYSFYMVGWLHCDDVGNYICESDSENMFDVTHWMPLPEPPKDGE